MNLAINYLAINSRRTWGRAAHTVAVLALPAALATLAACSSVPELAPGISKVDQIMGKASSASAAGNKAAAMGLWQQAATAAPASKEPWLRIAQTRYEAGQYGEAIIAAQEALVRDPSDKLANSIVAISGLRLSTRALSDLSRQNNLSGSLRSESQDLAKLLRESLGETVLVPVKPGLAGARPKAAGKAASRPASDDASANPFNALK